MSGQSCKKLGYRDRIGALIALSTATASRSAKRAECRVYRCPNCKRWHLTSKEASK